MIKPREALQKAQTGRRRVVNRDPGFSREQPRKRVYVAALGLRQNLPRLPGELFVIESAQLAAHCEAVFIAQLARAVAQHFETFGAQILRDLALACSTGVRFAVLDLVGNLARAGKQIAFHRKGYQQVDTSSLCLSLLGRLFEFCAQVGDGGGFKQIAVIRADARGFAVSFAAGPEEVVLAMKLGMEIGEALTVFAKHCALSISLRMVVRRLSRIGAASDGGGGAPPPPPPRAAGGRRRKPQNSTNPVPACARGGATPYTEP